MTHEQAKQKIKLIHKRIIDDEILCGETKLPLCSDSDWNVVTCLYCLALRRVH